MHNIHGDEYVAVVDTPREAENIIRWARFTAKGLDLDKPITLTAGMALIDKNQPGAEENSPIADIIQGEFAEKYFKIAS